jgi:guanosine-3',5'-bis(diphosphate) 3'-pyrophosphohydrolase
MIFRVPGLSRLSSAERAAKVAKAIPIRGLHGELAVRFTDGGAIPGDRIVGISTPGEGIVIYPIQSTALTEFDDQPDRWLDVRWDVDVDAGTRFPARIEITAINEPGTLAQIAQIIADSDGNISNIKILRSAPDFSELQIDLEVWDLKHLTRIIAQLRSRPVVSEAARVYG